jgi:hypothetical protein
MRHPTKTSPHPLSRRWASRRWASPPLWACLIASLSACGQDFEPRAEINYLRVLGIRAALPTLSPGDSTELTALIAQPPPDKPYTLSWELCLATDDASSKRACIQDPRFPPIVGEGPTFTVAYPAPAGAFVAEICDQLRCAADPKAPGCGGGQPLQLPEGFTLPNCDLEGFPAKVRLTVSAEGEEDLVAIKTLYLYPPLVNGTTQTVRNDPNRNPLITAFEVEGVPTALKRGEAYAIQCELNPDTIESFTPRGRDTPRQEEILFSWFISGAELENQLTYYNETLSPLAGAQRNRVTVSNDASEVRLWCVIRDGRGGIDWRALAFEVF